MILSVSNPESFHLSHKDGSETLKLYKDFYGTTDYSDKWLLAAFNEKSTESFPNGNADFTKLDLKGRSAAVQHGIRAMAIWGYIVGLVEKTAEDCRWDGTKENAVEQKMWDRAVALYVGSTARWVVKWIGLASTLNLDDSHELSRVSRRKNGEGGHLLYSLANEEVSVWRSFLPLTLCGQM